MSDFNIICNSTINKDCKQMYVSVPKSSISDLVENFFGDNHYAEFEELNSDNQQQKSGSQEQPLTKNEKIVRTMNKLVEEGSIKYQYEWAIIMQLLKEKYSMTFDNDQSFVDYLQMNGISHKAPTASDIRHLTQNMTGAYPEWNWTDKDSTESLRRNNLAKRFVNIYSKL